MTSNLFGYKLAPKSTCLLLAQLINNTIEYTSELTYFAINTFQTSSLRRVQMTTLARFRSYCVPRVCAFYYSLDREFEEFIRRMRQLCKRTQNTFLDIRAARIHFPQSSMFNTPETYRSLDILKCNIERLRDLKEIHQDLDHDLLQPNEQLFVALDLLVTNFELILCELDHRIHFQDSIILQAFIKDIFLQFRVALTWLYPAVKMAAYREGDPSKEFAVKKCDLVSKLRTEKVDEHVRSTPMSSIKIPLETRPMSDREASDNPEEVPPSVEQPDRMPLSLTINSTQSRSIDDSLSNKNTESQVETDELLDNDIFQTFINRHSITNNNDNKNYVNHLNDIFKSKQSEETTPEHCLLSEEDKEWYETKLNEIQRRLDADQMNVY